MEVEAPVVNQEVQKAKGQKSVVKGKWSKTHVSTSMEDDQVLSPTLIRSLPHFNGTYGVIHGEIPEVSEIAEVADASDPSITPSVEDAMGKTVEPLVVYDKSVDDVGKHVPVGDDIDLSHKDKAMTKGEKVPTTTDLGNKVETLWLRLWDADIASVVDRKPVTAKATNEGVIPSITDTNAESTGNMKRPTSGQGLDDTLDSDIQEVIPKDVGQKKKSKKRKHKKSFDVGESSKPKRKLSKEERKSKRARKAERKAKRAADEAADANNDGDNADEEAQESEEEHIAAVITKRRKATSNLKLNKNITRVRNKRVPKNVAAVFTTNVALNSEEERFVANRRVAAKKMLSEMTKKNPNIIGILEGAGVMPTVEAVGPYYPQLVRGFVCNMTKDIDDPASINFQKVTFCNFTFDFSPSLVNAFYGRANGGETSYNLQLSEIVKVLTGGVVDTWPDKGLPSSKLSVKYAVMHKVGVENWVPITHTIIVSETLAMVLYMIGTRALFNLGQFIFDQVVQHAQSHAILKPIAYPSMLCSILESHKEDILTAEDVEGLAPGFITISPKLMQGTQVADIPLVTVDTGGASGSGTDETAKILRDEIRYLDGVIQSSLARKSVLDERLRSLSGEDDTKDGPAVGESGPEAPHT
ncbi:hypothetical protein LIER_13330 [Lithospermum erythrorhizon]|uniref:Putative plant transposon protein domain-containing protein n=1 Tax=Lithospermum erythrorhizon TaxID=34254 RepID=A0AAV3PV17_LITER